MIVGSLKVVSLLVLQHGALRCPIVGSTQQIPWGVTFETIHITYVLSTGGTLQIMGKIGRTGVAGPRYDQATFRGLQVVCPPGWVKPILGASIINRMDTLVEANSWVYQGSL